MIQLTKLAKTLNKKEYVAWIKRDSHDYIIKDHYIIKTDKDIEGGALTKLVSLFGTMPLEGQGLQVRHGKFTELTESGINNLLELLNCKDETPICYTNLVHQTSDNLYSIFKGDKDYIFINKDYTDLVDLNDNDLDTFGGSPTSPIYFKKGSEEMMVLPVRLSEVPSYLKDISI